MVPPARLNWTVIFVARLPSARPTSSCAANIRRGLERKSIIEINLPPGTPGAHMAFSLAKASSRSSASGRPYWGLKRSAAKNARSSLRISWLSWSSSRCSFGMSSEDGGRCVAVHAFRTTVGAGRPPDGGGESDGIDSLVLPLRMPSLFFWIALIADSV